MTFRKLSFAQRQEIIAAFKHGNTHPNDLASYYNVSVTTVKNVLADVGLVKISSRKTPDQDAMLEQLKTLGITNVQQLRKQLMSTQSYQELFNQLTIEQRVACFTQSFTGMKSPPPELTDFTTTNSQDSPNVNGARHSS
ncbi:hypothetical protein [Acinetobacter sp. A47]|uniref:hypothetical protein n=1 Tax=Acinetobacter sp. A47 TaxID=1561217 RepID=UPI00056E34C9|nr:hypothetical protein [Acinetobacter sp. A47]